MTQCSRHRGRERLLGISRIIYLLFSSLLVVTSFSHARDDPCFNAVSWPEADVLFRGSSTWLGADSAFSIDLGGGRSLWLFGDSWIDSADSQSRNSARMVRNSIAIQSGSNPSNAEIEFYWQADLDAEPESFFDTGTNDWYWPGHGIRTDSGLILFLNRLRSIDAGLGFESVGWEARLIENPDDDPPDWRIRKLDTPTNRLGIQVGFAGALRHMEYLYAFGSADPDKTHPIYAVRWPLDAVTAGHLMAPEWWGGAKVGWMEKGSELPRKPLLMHGQSEMTIHFDKRTRQFISVQTVGFGKARLAIRTSPSLSAQWSTLKTIFDPPENGRPNVMIYAGKAHPQLEGADLVLTYATNTTEFSEHISDSEIYYPHFVRLLGCDHQ